MERMTADKPYYFLLKSNRWQSPITFLCTQTKANRERTYSAGSISTAILMLMLSLCCCSTGLTVVTAQLSPISHVKAVC